VAATLLVAVNVGGGHVRKADELFAFVRQVQHAQSTKEIDLQSIAQWLHEIDTGRRVQNDFDLFDQEGSILRF